MTRRDFIMLSDAVRATIERIKADTDDALLPSIQFQLRGVRRLACHIADVVAEDNPTFDMQRFFLDCGYGGTRPAHGYGVAGALVDAPAYRPRDMDDAGQPVVPVPPPPRESAKQISARILRGDKPDPTRISNINAKRSTER